MATITQTAYPESYGAMDESHAAPAESIAHPYPTPPEPATHYRGLSVDDVALPVYALGLALLPLGLLFSATTFCSNVRKHDPSE